MLPSPVRRGVAGLLPAAALLSLGLAGVALAADRSTAAVTGFLVLLASGVLAVLGLAVDAGRRGESAIAALLLAPPLVVFPADQLLRSATVVTLLAIAVAVAAARLGPALAARGDTGVARVAGLAFAANLVLHADRLWTRPLPLLALVGLVVAPCLAALSWRLLAAEPAFATLSLLAAFAAGPGWSAASCLALLALAAVRRSTGRQALARALSPVLLAAPAFAHEPWPIALGLATAVGVALLSAPASLARAGRSAIAALAFAALLAGGMPWKRPAPLSAALAAAITPPLRTVERPIAAESRVLRSGATTLELPLSGEAIRAVVVDSFVSDSLALPCGTAVGRVQVDGVEGTAWEGEVRVGADTGEWAVRRPDVAAAIACRALAPSLYWPKPDGRFFAANYRTRFLLPRQVEAAKLRFVLDDRLPRPTQWVLLGARTEQ